MSEKSDLNHARYLLHCAANILCAAKPEHGDHCHCGANVGVREKHKDDCLYVKIMEFLNVKSV